MKKSKTNNDTWTQLNDFSQLVVGNKGAPSKTIKRCIISIITLILTLGTIFTTYFVGQAMQSAFNNATTSPARAVKKSIVADMNEVPITESNESLRLTYFKETVKKQVFQQLTDNYWWDTVLSTDINDFEFTYFASNQNNNGIDKDLIQQDGLVSCNLTVKLKNYGFHFDIPVLTQIKNTAEFYEKFFMFNQFEGRYWKHQSGKNPLNSAVEERSQGYLPHIFHYNQTNVDNMMLYQTIQDELNHFISNYPQEFASNTKLYPILTTIPLDDIDIDKPDTLLPYAMLIIDPDNNYINNVPQGDPHQYVDINNFASVQWPFSPDFYITYVSKPDLIDQLIAAHLTTEDEMIDFFKKNPCDYLPFNYVQEGLDNSSFLETYQPSHQITVADHTTRKPYQYWELSQYFADSYPLNNRILNINVSKYPNINALETFLIAKAWDEMYQFLQTNKTFFALKYPDKTLKPDQNWEIAAKTINILKVYFINAWYITTNELINCSYLNSNHDDIIIQPTDPIDVNEIKNIKIRFGPPEILDPPFIIARSFSWLFKINWTF